MNKTDFLRKVSVMGLKLKKASPTIGIVAGSIGVVVSGVLACRATLKLSGILDEHKNTVEEIKEHTEAFDENATESDVVNGTNKAVAMTYLHTGLSVARIYVMPVTIGALSIGAIIGSHVILRKRNIALAAAYETINKSFKVYRARVIEELGDEMDKRFRFGVKEKLVTETVTDEDGNETKEEKRITVADVSYSDYARIFDEACAGWSSDPDYARMFLTNAQAWANNKLQAQGYLFLNDVYHELGFEKTKAGQIVGWVYDPENPIGDNFVDFGLYDTSKNAVKNFLRGDESSIILDFNVDGNILDYI